MWIPVSPFVAFAVHLFVPADAALAAAPTASPPAAGVPPASAAPAAPTTTAPLTNGGDAKLDGLLDAIQKTYDGTTDFSASFTQRYTVTMLRRTQESRGEVRFKKPGLMRWDYQQPQPKAFVIDGKALWIHQPADKNVFVNACFQQNSDLVAPIAFMWGQGRIRDQFNAAWFAGTFGEKTDHHLELTPKAGSSVFAKLILVVDPQSHRVKQSIVVDPSGNVNQFIFSKLQFNTKQKDAAFQFAPPAGEHVARMPGSCADPIAGLP